MFELDRYCITIVMMIATIAIIIIIALDHHQCSTLIHQHEPRLISVVTTSIGLALPTRRILAHQYTIHTRIYIDYA